MTAPIPLNATPEDIAGWLGMSIEGELWSRLAMLRAMMSMSPEDRADMREALQTISETAVAEMRKREARTFAEQTRAAVASIESACARIHAANDERAKRDSELLPVLTGAREVIEDLQLENARLNGELLLREVDE